MFEIVRKRLTSFLQSGTGAVTRSIYDKLADQVSVFDFMTAAQIADVKARTTLVDVTSPCQAAINYAKGSNLALVFPGGTYLCNTATAGVILDITADGGSCLTLTGDGPNRTIIQTATASADLMSAVSTSSVGGNPRYTLKGFSLRGPDTGATTNSGNGLVISGATFSAPICYVAEIQSYYFKGAGKSGVLLVAPEDSGFRDIETQFNDIGLKATTNFNGNTVDNLLAGQNKTYGIYSNSNTSNAWNNLVVQSNEKWGWYVDGGFIDNVINSPHFENNNTTATATTGALGLYASAAKGIISNNHILSSYWGATADRLYISGEAGFVVGFNVFQGAYAFGGNVLITMVNAYETSNSFAYFTTIASITGWNAADDIIFPKTGQSTFISSGTITGPIKIDGTFKLPQSAGTAIFSMDTATETAQSVANNATITPLANSNNFSGLILITDTGSTGATAVFLVGGGACVKVSETGATFSATLNNGGTLNLYLAASILTVQNKLGSDSSVRVLSFRTRIQA